MEDKCYEPRLRFPGFRTKALTLSYDDGRTYDRQMVEILNRYGIKCTFNLSAGMLTRNPEKYVTPEEVKTLYAGHEVACHGYNHTHLEAMPGGADAYQLVADRRFLEDLLQKPVWGFAYPYGCRREKERLGELVKVCGLRYGRTVNNHHSFVMPEKPELWDPTCWHGDQRLQELTEKFLAEDTTPASRLQPKLFYIWGHSYEYADGFAPLEHMCKNLAGHHEVWYVTNGDFLEYYQAYKSLRYSIDGHHIYNSTATTVYLYLEGENVTVGPGEYLNA